MAKVIIEVKSLQNNDLIGRLVVSIAGRDTREPYIVIDNVGIDYLLLANGCTKTIEKPKKKKLKHLNLTNVVSEEIKKAIFQRNKNTDIMIRKFLKLEGIVKEG
ncbi:RNA-binding protein [Clostridium polynesiense]|uniref:RNA-binding protein n=1 Tax=Clostridium polynesiense TaxID=1325933 RepID=UPI0009E1CF0B